ncbi:MAG TPA: hypothetical protein PKI62_08680 [bacterium]|nr:hypothetical protein [bacterium]HPR87475.1 hypothetical protein [bacterium]
MRARRPALCALACSLILAPAAGIPGLAAAQSARYAAASQDLGVGARPLALGGAAAAMAGGPELFHYNPASLGFCSRREVGLMYAPTFGSITAPMATFHYAGGILPLHGGGSMALHWTRFSVDDIPLYPKLAGSSFLDRLQDPSLRPDGVPQGYFKDTEDAFYLSFARIFRFAVPLGWLYTDLAMELPVGLNIKLLRQSLYERSASGLGIDLGMMARFNLGQLLQSRRLGDLTLGVSAIDLTRTTLVWDNQREEKITTTALWGLGYSQPLAFRGSRLDFFWSWRKKEQRNSLFGVEYTLKGFALRLGRNESGLTTGAGVRWRRMRVDYAFTSLDFADVHRLGCGFVF